MMYMGALFWVGEEIKIHCDLSFQPIWMILVPKYSSWWVLQSVKRIKKIERVQNGQKGQKWSKKAPKISFWPFLTIFNYFLNFFIIFLETTHHDEYFGTKIIKIGWKLRSQWMFTFFQELHPIFYMRLCPYKRFLEHGSNWTWFRGP